MRGFRKAENSERYRVEAPFYVQLAEQSGSGLQTHINSVQLRDWTPYLRA